jgi:archaellum component FlaC
MALDKAKSKAKSKAAEWFAETKKLEAELTGAKAKLKALQVSDAVVDKVGDLPVVGEHTDWVQQQMDAFVADAEADVQRLEAELLIAKGKLKTAQKAKSAVDAVSDTVEDVKSSVSEAAEELKD